MDSFACFDMVGLLLVHLSMHRILYRPRCGQYQAVIAAKLWCCIAMTLLCLQDEAMYLRIARYKRLRLSW